MRMFEAIAIVYTECFVVYRLFAIMDQKWRATLSNVTRSVCISQRAVLVTSVARICFHCGTS